MKYTLLRLMAAILFSTSACAWAGTIFKCKNSAGVMLYQEKPCEKEVQSVSSWASTSTTTVEVDADSAGGRTPSGHRPRGRRALLHRWCGERQLPEFRHRYRRHDCCAAARYGGKRGREMQEE